jgi:omega-amidase
MPAETSWNDIDAVRRNTDRAIDHYRAVADDSDLVVLPECVLTGYIPLKGYDQGKKRALARSAAACWEGELPRLVAETRDRRAAVVVGHMEPSTMRNEMHNSLSFAEGGEILGTYRKVHLPVEENHYFSPGDGSVVVDARVGRVGLIICYDILFPESARAAALGGAEILCVSSNWLDLANLVELSRVLPVARALEDQLHVVFVNGVGELEARGRRFSLFGQSRIVDACGAVLAASDDSESVITAVLEASRLEAASDVFPVLRDRRPETYGELVAPHAQFAAGGRV